MFIRLLRAEPWKAQIGCGTVISLTVAAPGAFIIYMTYLHDQSENRGPMFAFGGVWILVGLVVFLSSLHQAFASRSPETIVEIEPAELTPGETLRIRVSQPGPLRLLSLHANLAGEQSTYKFPFSFPGQGGKRTRTIRYLGPHRMLEIGRQRIDPGEQLQREASFVVPDLAPSTEEFELQVRWKIEIWGRVAFWPDFMHPFPVRVVTAASRGKSSQ